MYLKAGIGQSLLSQELFGFLVTGNNIPVDGSGNLDIGKKQEDIKI